MVQFDLVIKCMQCGKEETIVEVVDERVVDINLNKICSNCHNGWMIRKELTIKKISANRQASAVKMNYRDN
jgi:hypothetical protein